MKYIRTTYPRPPFIGENTGNRVLPGPEPRTYVPENVIRISPAPVTCCCCLKKNQSNLDLLSIPQLGGGNVKTFRLDQRLQIQNLFMAFKRVPRCK